MPAVSLVSFVVKLLFDHQGHKGHNGKNQRVDLRLIIESIHAHALRRNFHTQLQFILPLFVIHKSI